MYISLFYFFKLLFVAQVCILVYILGACFYLFLNFFIVLAYFYYFILFYIILSCFILFYPDISSALDCPVINNNY